MLPLQVNSSIKQKFLDCGAVNAGELTRFSNTSLGSPGHEWDALLSGCIKRKRSSVPLTLDSLSSFSLTHSSKQFAAADLISYVENRHKLTFLESKFPLYGFMREVAKDQKNPSKLYLWQGEADAIAYSYLLHKCVIVDFKVVDNLLDYWQKKTDLCGKHLHQCLVYAKLLQLQMDLDDLPPVLIVAIDRFTGMNGYFPLFEDYPEECKKRLDEYEWFKGQPRKRHPLKIFNPEKLLNPFIMSGFIAVSPKTTLQALFNGAATVEDLLDLLGCDSIEIVPSGSSNTND